MGGLQERALTHPLDPLDADEIEAAAGACRAAGPGRGQPLRHDRPAASRDKRALLEWEQGGAEPAREAEVVILDRSARETVEATVAVGSGEVTRWVRRADIQPMAVVSELVEAEQAVLLDPRVPGGDGAARRDRHGHRAGRRLAGRPLRPGRGDGPAAVPGGGLPEAGAGRQRVGASRRRGDRAARPEHARGAAGGRPRGGADPARERQLRRRRGGAAARRHRAASDHAARGPRLHPRGPPAARGSAGSCTSGSRRARAWC